jgi:hypothetical protein
MAKATSLIKAYTTETIPSDGGFIITGIFEEGSAYAIYEITAYRNVKDIFRTTDGLIFKTDGNRTHILVEPASFSQKHTEPVNREAGRSIPYRFNEMQIITSKNHERVMIPKEPVFLYSSFTILEKKSDYFAFIFHPTQDVYIAMKKFIADSLFNDCNISKHDSVNISTEVMNTVKKFSIFNG